MRLDRRNKMPAAFSFSLSPFRLTWTRPDTVQARAHAIIHMLECAIAHPPPPINHHTLNKPFSFLLDHSSHLLVSTSFKQPNPLIAISCLLNNFLHTHARPPPFVIHRLLSSLQSANLRNSLFTWCRRSCDFLSSLSYNLIGFNSTCNNDYYCNYTDRLCFQRRVLRRLSIFLSSHSPFLSQTLVLFLLSSQFHSNFTPILTLNPNHRHHVRNH